MELKVWVDGIQRVVCGVSDTTTCQDVVYALAHATGQTGRFTLAEKWRNNERLLAPHEHPLKVLVKWGEHSSDVQFVLRRSQPSHKNVASPPAGGKRQHDFLHSFSPTNATSHAPPLSPQQNKEIKKSLTFSGGHTAGESPNNSANPKQELSQWDRKSKEPRNKQDVPRGIVRGIPQQHPRPTEPNHSSDSPSKQKTDRPLHPPSYDEAVTKSTWQPPSHIHSAAIYPDHDSPSSKRRHLAGSRVNQGQESRSSPSRTKDEIREGRLTSPQSGYQHNFHVGPPQEGSLDKVTSKPRKDEVQIATSPSSIANKTSQSREDVLHDPQYRDLMRLVSLQREKLTNQNAELSQYDSEIVYWENRLQEQEERLSALEEELVRLEATNAQQGEELVQLDELEKGRQDERTLRSRLSMVRSQLQGCEAELLQQRQSLSHLTDEMECERRRSERRQEREEVEIEEAKEELKKQNDQLESQSAAIGEVEKDLHKLETDLNEKQILVEKLVEELREENLKSLSLSITEDIHLVAEGSTRGQGFHNRPGSTRRILGSPRQLENAVPTSKNPHGVWV